MLIQKIAKALRKTLYAAPVPNDEAGRYAYDEGFNSPDTGAVNGYRNGSRLHTAWRHGEKDRDAHENSLW